MNLDQLIDQQKKEIDVYNTARNKAWDELKKAHNELTASFGGVEHLPNSIRKMIDEQTESYRAEWSMYTGERHKAILENQQKQREQLTGKPQTQKPVRNTNPLNDNQQEKLQKIIAQQQAIRQRNQERKRNK